MSTDDTAMNAQLNDYSGDAYDALIKDAEVDNRVGKHKAIIIKRDEGVWPSGDKRYKYVFSLLTAGNAKADLTWSEPPTPEELAKLLPTMEPKVKKAISANITHARQCAQHYGKSIKTLQEGEEFFVETIKTRREKDGSGGFIRVIAFLAPQAADGNAPAGGPGF